MSQPTVPADLTTVLCEVSEGVAQVTLNRPEVHNAFNEAMQDELRAVWRWARDDDRVRVIVLTGVGDKAFCTGIDRADIPETEYDPFTYEDP
ncbi:MAG TPA: enoyl-CoA hydratase-related protein, partial [Acidimicrobiales bacterium]